MSSLEQSTTAAGFRGRTPRALAFGTSGLRGLVDDITDLEAYINTRGFLDYLTSLGACTAGSEIALGGDLRPSTTAILEAVARAVRDAGMTPRYQGRLPTPALTAWAIHAGVPSIMVTGSHIPFDRNGIKFNKPDGEVLKTDEAPILAAVARIREAEYQRSVQASAFNDDGSLRQRQCALPEAEDKAIKHYAARYRDAFPADALAGLRLGFFAHSAVGRDLVPELLTKLGASVHSFGRSEVFTPIDTEALAAETLEELQQQADTLGSAVGPLHAVISTDGDSDRPLLLVADSSGQLRFISGDLLGLAVAEYLDADSVAVPVSASDAIEQHLHSAHAERSRRENGKRAIDIRRTRIGSPWVIAAMQSQTGTRRVGWEANGGFLVGSDLHTHTGRLAALPTRDALLPLIAALHAARQGGNSLLEWFLRFPARFSRAGLLDNITPERSSNLLQQLGPPSAHIRRLQLAESGPSAEDHQGRPCDVSAADSEDIERRATLLERHLATPLGITGHLKQMDALDGLRLYFGNGEIIHLRASGNAPQLRIYAVADSEQRAQALVDQALATPQGVLMQLLQRF